MKNGVLKKFLAILLCAVSVMSMAGCKEKYVDMSNAAEIGEFDRPDYAREMEALHDAQGREHIEIPEGADVVTIDGEDYIPITDLSQVQDMYGNYIMSCDIDVQGRFPTIGGFRGKFNGNNYKLYGKTCNAIFGTVDNAEICNVILSSDIEYVPSGYEPNAMFIITAYNSIIKNIINYADYNSTYSNYGPGMIDSIVDSIVEGCENYADFKVGRGVIVVVASGNYEIRNCINYGNLSGGSRTAGILGIPLLTYKAIGQPRRVSNGLVENCINYGKIIGASYVGGIVAGLDYEEYRESYAEIGYDFNNLDVNTLISIRNCENYGDIYRNKEYTDGLSCIGGIVGSGSTVVDCKNSGNIYGFETVPPNSGVKNIGGIAGAAYVVEGCENTAELNIDLQVLQYGDICGSLLG